MSKSVVLSAKLAAALSTVRAHLDKGIDNVKIISHCYGVTVSKLRCRSVNINAVIDDILRVCCLHLIGNPIQIQTIPGWNCDIIS